MSAVGAASIRDLSNVSDTQSLPYGRSKGAAILCIAGTTFVLWWARHPIWQATLYMWLSVAKIMRDGLRQSSSARLELALAALATAAAAQAANAGPALDAQVAALEEALRCVQSLVANQRDSMPKNPDGKRALEAARVQISAAEAQLDERRLRAEVLKLTAAVWQADNLRIAPKESASALKARMERLRDMREAVVTRTQYDVPTLAREAQRRLLEEADFQLRMAAGWLRSLEELLRLQLKTPVVTRQPLLANPADVTVPATGTARRGRLRLRSTSRRA